MAIGRFATRRVSEMYRESVARFAEGAADMRPVAADMRIELRPEGEPAGVLRLHASDFEDPGALVLALLGRSTWLDAAPLDHDAGLTPRVTLTVLANDAGADAAFDLFERLGDLLGLPRVDE